MILRYEKVLDEIETIPPNKPKDETDAGWDIRTPRRIKLEPGWRVKIKTNMRIWFEPTPCESRAEWSWYGQLWVPSGIADDYGIMLLAGVIDRDYRGELKVLLYNSGEEPWEVSPGGVICQIVPMLIWDCREAALGTPETTTRGSDGFGSTRQSSEH